MDNRFTILTVDDNPLFLKSTRRLLTGKVYNVETAGDGFEALHLLETKQVNLILLDIEMPRRDGFSLLEDIVQLYPNIPVLMLSGHGSVQYAVKAIKLGADDFLEKPCSTKVLLKRIASYHALWKQSNLEDLPRPRTFDFPDLVGESTAMERVKSLIIRVATSDAPVLLLGESGTGKELAAKAIHEHSRRRNGPFVTVDCATLSEAILESELFGHRKGAFTGAEEESLGLIRAANAGTLFLDEIGELPMNMQAKLLRFLQESEVRPVGGQKAHRVDIRVIAATNRDLEEEVAARRFRSDLYYRISAIPLSMPPLRERLEDISLLAQHFLKRHSPERPIELHEDSLSLLSNFSWPGNVRELENVLRRALAFCESQTITTEDLPATIAISTAQGSLANLPQDDSLVAYERLAIENALQKSAGNKRKAAALLGIGEATLYRKLQKFGLSN